MESQANSSTLDLVRQFRRKAEAGFEAFAAPAWRSAAHFDERRYLFANPEVAQAVERGRFRSALDHWIRNGWAEGRPGGPADLSPARTLGISELERRSVGLNVYGTLSVPSGLGGVARGMATAAEHAGLPVNRIDTVKLAPLREPPNRVNLLFPPLTGFESFLSQCGTRLFEGAYNIGFWFWELPAPHPYWTRHFRYFDEIWVASEFCRDTFQCLTSLPVVRLPPLVDGLEKDASFGRDHFGFAEGVFVFTYVFATGSNVSRKNPYCLIRAFRGEFGDSSKVMLFLKVWNSGSDAAAIRELEDAIRGAPNIRLYDGVFSDSEIASLHRQADCLVSPHRSEGFGLNIAETMYFGKPVIATGYSANLDFMNDENGYLIDCRLTPLAKPDVPYWEGAVWAEPSEDHLRALMRRVLDNQEERARKGEAARATIRRDYSLDAVARAMQARFAALGLDAASLAHLELAGHPDPSRLFPASMDARRFARVLRVKPRIGISIIMAVSGGVNAEDIQCSVESVRGQWYPVWDLTIVEDGSAAASVREFLLSLRGQDERIKVLLDVAAAPEKAVEMSMYVHLLLLPQGSVLKPDALLEIVEKPVTLLSKTEYYNRPPPSL